MEDEQTDLGVPVEILENILSYCSYDDISINKRLVCKSFNYTCKRLLNRGFSKVDKYHASIQKIIKNKLPRRESERRNHELAKHVNALSAIETRLSLLNMTYMKYIDMQMCCFIPGKVLDEMLRVLRALADVDTPPRSHELLQELRDISSMAMEHFDDKIVATLRFNMPAVDLNGCMTGLSTPLTPSMSPSNDLSDHVARWTTSTQQLNLRQPGYRQELNNVKATLRVTSLSLVGLKKHVAGFKTTENEQTKKIVDMESTIREQSQQLAEQQQKISDQEQKLRDLTSCNIEYGNKLTEVYHEISKLRSEVGLEASDNIVRALNTDICETLTQPSCSATHLPYSHTDSMTTKRKRDSESNAEKRRNTRAWKRKRSVKV